jgi:hypothetical protein
MGEATTEATKATIKDVVKRMVMIMEVYGKDCDADYKIKKYIWT